jgi:molecular chaperone GrpE
MTSENKQQLVENFRDFIENLPETPMYDVETDEGVDVLQVFQELAELKTEVKQSSRQFKTALESFKAVFTTLEQSHDDLSKELTHRRQEQVAALEKQHKIILKPILLELLELYDRLNQGVLYSKRYQPRWLIKFFKREKVLLSTLSEGQVMTLRRLEQVLENYGVHALEVVHQCFDPIQMRATELEQCTTLPNGVVTAELRKGFMWNEEVLRVAEVKVNKWEESL